MRSSSKTIRWPLILIVAGLSGITFLILELAPALYGLLPSRFHGYSFEISATALTGLFLATRSFFQSRSWRAPEMVRGRQLFDRLDDIARWALDGGLVRILAVLIVAMILTWIPHYLTWPWCRDADTFATLAQSWDFGIRPYRDIRGYNFPGHIYLHWLLGKIVGWGSTRVFYATDAALLVGLGVTMKAWSQRRFGGVFPGLAAYFIFLGYYLNLHYEIVAQRDWHATLCASLALLILETWTGRRGLWIAAALEAVGLTIRPHVVLFLPAMAWAILERPKARRALLEWAMALAAMTALGFLPLIADGILDDLVRGLRIASYGGPYSKASPELAFELLRKALLMPWIYLQLAYLILLCRYGQGLGRSAATWLLALVGAIVYRTLHPLQHQYLEIPLALISSISVALPLASIASLSWMMPPLRAIVLLLIFIEAVPRVPAFCAPLESARALVAIARGVETDKPPPGCRYKPFRPSECHYEWSDYCRTLEYLRRETKPEVEIANLLKEYPYPSFNGPVGRLSPFRVESGICWMLLVNEDLDRIFSEALEQSPNAIVVWSPREITTGSRLRLDQLSQVVFDRYHAVAKFGSIEVWRRNTDDPT